MTPERWQRVDALFGGCIGLDEPARRALLDRECADDPQLRRVVEGMIEADASGKDSLKEVIGECAAQVSDCPAEQWHDRVLGAYRIERQIGAGGMGTVFLARRTDAEYERRVAIKVLSNALASLDDRRRFVSERQILANLTHPNIAQLLDGGTTAEGVPYLVMEYIEGVPIDEYCVARSLSLSERLRLFLRVCHAVQYAHQNLVIHRDLKPGNILVTADGTPKLLDFGIAKLLDATAMPRTVAMTIGGARLLTPRHASPEQIRGEPVTTASDVYSLGVLLYRLLTNHDPYEIRGESVSEAERVILETHPQRPSAASGRSPGVHDASEARRWRRQLSGELDTIVLMALRKEPDRRYATVRELAHDLECYLENRPITARPDSPAYRLRKFVERHAAGVAIGATATVTIVALASFYTVRLAQERDIQSRERAGAERVAQFMVDIFRVANPQNGESSVTARELLDQGYDEITQRLAEQPLVAAKLMMAMGRAYSGLAMFDRSVELERKALDLRRTYLPEDDPDVAEALHYLGTTHADRGDYTSARENLEAALAIRENRLGPAALSVGETLTRLAFVDLRESKYPAMRARLDRALAIYMKDVGPKDRQTADVHALLGAYHWAVGNFPQAREAFGQALAIEEHMASPNNVRIAGFIHNLGLLAWQMGEYPQAIELYQRELILRETHLGPEHPSVALALYGLGVSSGYIGNYRDSLDYFQRAAALQEKVLGPDSHYLAMTLGGYGFTLLRIEDFTGARRALARALAIFEASVGPRHPDLRAPLAGLAKVAIAEGRFHEAHERLGRALAIVETKFAPEHPDVLRTRVSLGDVFRAEGKHPKALEYYEPSIAAFKRTLGLNHPYAADALCGTGDSLTRLGQLTRAEEHYELALTNLAAQKFADRRAQVAECLEDYSALLRRLGRRAEANDIAARANRTRDYVRAARHGEPASIH